MRNPKLLIAVIVVALAALVWWWTRSPDAHVDAGPSVERATDVVATTDDTLKSEAANERAALSPPLPDADSRRANHSEPAPAPAFSYWARVLGANDSLPIVGARVTWTTGAAEPELHTDSGGFFHVMQTSSAGKIARIDAVGYGPRLAEVSEDHATAESADEIRLARAAALDAEVVDARGQPLSGVRVSLAADPFAIGRLASLFFQPPDVVWSAETGVSGKCSIEDVAADVALALVVRRGADELHREKSELTLEPGERREWRCTIGGRARLSGVAIDQDEHPVAGLELWLMSDALYGESESARRYFHFNWAHVISQSAATDATGAFAFEKVTAGTWCIGPAPTQREPSADAIAPAATRVVIDVGQLDARVLLRVSRGLYIRGRVIRPDGTAVSYAQVSASSNDPTGECNANSRADGTFALGPLVPSECRVVARERAGFPDGASAIAHAGDENVVLTLSPPASTEWQSASVKMYAVDARSGAPCHARFLLQGCWPGSLGMSVEQITQTATPGPTSKGGLTAGVYDISARTDDGRVGITHDVALVGGAEPAEVTVRVLPGAKLRIRLEGRAQTLGLEVVSDGMNDYLGVISNGGRKLAVVPAGVTTVRLTSGETLIEERDVKALAGETVEVVFRRDG